jgi:hypothetical protein
MSIMDEPNIVTSCEARARTRDAALGKLKRVEVFRNHLNEKFRRGADMPSWALGTRGLYCFELRGVNKIFQVKLCRSFGKCRVAHFATNERTVNATSCTAIS